MFTQPIFQSWAGKPARMLIVAITLFAATQSAPGQHGRFLPNPGGSVNEYGYLGGTVPLTYDRPINDLVKNIPAGNIRFDYDIYTRNPAPPTRGGAYLAGGFFPNPNVRVKPDYTLIWTQMVLATVTVTEAETSWNLPHFSAGTYPDADPQNRPPPNFGPNDPQFAPSYPFTTPPANTTGQAPMIPGQTFPTGFQDSPSRPFAGPDGGNQVWLATLALACVSNTPVLGSGATAAYDVRVITTFEWGYQLQGLPANPPGTTNILPRLQDDATGGANFIGVMNGFYDGLGGGGGTANGGAQVASRRYTFSSNTNCFLPVPEPATLGMLAMGMLLLARRSSSRRPVSLDPL